MYLKINFAFDMLLQNRIDKSESKSSERNQNRYYMSRLLCVRACIRVCGGGACVLWIRYYTLNYITHIVASGKWKLHIWRKLPAEIERGLRTNATSVKSTNLSGPRASGRCTPIACCSPWLPTRGPSTSRGRCTRTVSHLHVPGWSPPNALMSRSGRLSIGIRRDCSRSYQSRLLQYFTIMLLYINIINVTSVNLTWVSTSGHGKAIKRSWKPRIFVVLAVSAF